MKSMQSTVGLVEYGHWRALARRRWSATKRKSLTDFVLQVPAWKRPSRTLRVAGHVAALLMVVAIGASMIGCATYRTISSAEIGTAKVFSGTRLDVIAIRGGQPSEKRFKVAPPKDPAIDLPLSFALDVVILPLTVPSALYEVAFE